MQRLYAVIGIVLLPCSTLHGQSAFVDSVHQVLKDVQGTKRIQRLYEIAAKNAHVSLKDVRQLAQEGLRLAQSIEDAELEIEGNLLIADLSSYVSETTYIDSMLQQAMHLAEKTGQVDIILETNYAMSKFLGRSGRQNESIQLLKTMLPLALEENDTLMQARILMALGINEEHNAAYEKALQYYYQALPLYETLGDDYRIGLTYINIGMSFLGLGRNTEALAEFQKSLVICEAQGDIEGIMVNTLNIGVAYQRLEQYDLAAAAYTKSLKTATTMGSWVDIAILTENLGTTAIAQGNYTTGLQLLERSYAIKDSIGYTYDLPHTLNSLARAHFYLKEYNDAIAKASEAITVAQQYQTPDHLSQSHRILADIYAAQHNFTLAFQHLQRHKQLSDSLFSTESDKAISDLKIQYETTLKENQIDELRVENQRRRTAQLVYLAIAFLILITGASVIYALYQRRTRDSMLIAKERELHDHQNRFFANISHEFRTPLTLILGPVHHLRKQFEDSKEEPSLRTIQKNAERLLLLINQILDLTKFDQKSLELKKEIFDVTGMIQGICSSFDSLAEDRGINFTYEIAENLCLHGDVRRLEVVLINLISNAFKFTPDHGTIAVTTEINARQDTFKIQVKDSGAGIHEENLSRIFDRFYHDDREAHSDFEGAGIGLALSKHIVDMHDGQITVSSKRNEGTVFTVSLPYQPGSVVSSGTVRKESIQATGSVMSVVTEQHSTLFSNGEKPLVLLVEDRKDMREYIATLLRPNYEMMEASDAFKGRELAIEHIPDIIISDVMMPRKSGLELCQELKTDLRTSHIPVLLLTAKSSPEDRLSGLETAADIYLTKPFIPEELELHLRNLIVSRRKIREFFASHHRIEPSKMSFNSVDAQFLETLSSELEANYAKESFSVEQLADLMHLSRSQLHRKISALTGHAPNRLIRTFRLKRAYDMVASNTASISEIAYNVGFSSPAYFNKCFVEEFGVTPGEVKKGAPRPV